MTANTLIYLIAVFFLLMGLAGIFRPMRILNLLSVKETSPEMRNEARAVYGGFGIAIAVALFLATRLDGLRVGILFTVSLSMLGMAFGRIASLLVERPTGKNPYIFLILEILLSLALGYAYWIY